MKEANGIFSPVPIQLIDYEKRPTEGIGHRNMAEHS